MACDEDQEGTLTTHGAPCPSTGVAISYLPCDAVSSRFVRCAFGYVSSSHRSRTSSLVLNSSGRRSVWDGAAGDSSNSNSKGSQRRRRRHQRSNAVGRTVQVYRASFWARRERDRTFAPEADLCTYRPIGHLRSCCRATRNTSARAPGADGAARLRLDAQVVQPAAALDGSPRSPTCGFSLTNTKSGQAGRRQRGRRQERPASGAREGATRRARIGLCNEDATAVQSDSPSSSCCRSTVNHPTLTSPSPSRVPLSTSSGSRAPLINRCLRPRRRHAAPRRSGLGGRNSILDVMPPRARRAPSISPWASPTELRRSPKPKRR